MELWDGYYADGTPAGVTLERGKPLPTGIYHLGVEILVRHTDGSYLLMLRDPRKPSHGGQYETSMGGCVVKGEDPLTAAHRELREETGLDETCFELIKRNVCPGGAIIYNYLCVTSRPKDSVTLQEGETVGYKWVSEAELLRYIDSPDAIKTQVERFRVYFDGLTSVRSSL